MCALTLFHCYHKFNRQKDDVTKTPVFDTPVAIANKNPSSESPSFTSSSTELPHDTTDASHASALLGTATGIVIFAIIVILVWFIRKKTMAESGSQAANDKDTYAVKIYFDIFLFYKNQSKLF